MRSARWDTGFEQAFDRFAGWAVDSTTPGRGAQPVDETQPVIEDSATGRFRVEAK
jgi:hypothetical protein